MGFVFLGAVVVEICFVEVGHVLKNEMSGSGKQMAIARPIGSGYSG